MTAEHVHFYVPDDRHDEPKCFECGEKEPEEKAQDVNVEQNKENWDDEHGQPLHRND